MIETVTSIGMVSGGIAILLLNWRCNQLAKRVDLLQNIVTGPRTITSHSETYHDRNFRTDLDISGLDVFCVPSPGPQRAGGCESPSSSRYETGGTFAHLDEGGLVDHS